MKTHDSTFPPFAIGCLFPAPLAFVRGTVSGDVYSIPSQDTENCPGGGSHPTLHNDADIDRRATRGMNSALRGELSRDE